MQAQEGTQGAAFLDGSFLPRHAALRARGGPLASNDDAPSFLRLVRTGERWFELQTAVVCYMGKKDEKVCWPVPNSSVAASPSPHRLPLLACQHRAPPPLRAP